MKLRPPSPPTEQELIGCRLLLLEIVKRAVYDWILYRTSRRREYRAVAGEAYVWLFEENEEHDNFLLEKKEGTHLTSFLTICEIMDVSPQFLRICASRMTAKDILNAGRPPDRRKPEKQDKGGIDEPFLHGLLETYRDYAPIEDAELLNDRGALRRAADVP